jgi:UDPglucose 6-dehydrogenase
LGHAVQDFLQPQRIVVGVRSDRDRQTLTELLSPLTDLIEWMSVEAAEMTKHAINAFLAASVVFANEIASLCESVGVAAKEVERGLKSDRRIGPRAYLAPGAAFSGGTLARDVAFLNGIARESRVPTPLLSAILPSNELHKSWVKRHLPDLAGVTVAVWGLAYKPGTDTLRRSLAVELCDWMIGEGATVRVHDPLVKELPPHWAGVITRYADPAEALQGAAVLVVATEWPDYRSVAIPEQLVVLDANRFLTATGPKYFAVGSG